MAMQSENALKAGFLEPINVTTQRIFKKSCEKIALYKAHIRLYM